MNLENEISEVLHIEMNDFIANNPSWDQYSLMNAALADFLFQNGCEEKVVVERYLNNLFTRF